MFTELASQGPLIAFFVILLGALLSKKLYLPREMEEKETQLGKAELDRDYWKDIAFKALNIGEKISEDTLPRRR